MRKNMIILAMFLLIIGGITMGYTRINWEDTPSTNTPRNAHNLNIMDKGIYDIGLVTDGMQSQLDTIVVEGDSSVEAAQARVSSSGTTYPTLKARLDKENADLKSKVDEANNNSSSIIAPGEGINPTSLNFDLISINSGRLGMIENFNESFNVDINSNNMGTFKSVDSLLSSSTITFDSTGNELKLTNSATAGTLTKIENDNASIVYTGGWSTVPIAGYSGGSGTYSGTPTNYMTYTFFGTGIKFYSAKSTDFGIADIYIDNVLVSTVDLYNSTYIYQQMVFSSLDLSYGTHVLKVLIKNTKNASSTAYVVPVDYFEVFGAESESTHKWIKTPIKFLAPNFSLRMTVKSDTVTGSVKSSAMIGLIKDGNNWVMCNYNKTSKKISIVNYKEGVYSLVASSTVYEEISAPYELIMLVKNHDLTFVINKNGNIKGYVQTQYTAFDFKNPSVLNQFTLGFCSKLFGGQSMSISNIKSGYDQGVAIGSDYKLITYEDGSPLKNDNCYYFTASEHSTGFATAGSGALVYKININSLNPEFVGVVFTKLSDTDIHGDQTCKIIYDRNQKCFIYLANDFQTATPHFTVGKTKANLLSGINIVQVQQLNIPDAATSAWDGDLIYDVVTQKYKLVYVQNWILKMAEATDVYGVWSVLKTNASAVGEGAVFTKINGKFYITFSIHSPVLQLYDYDLNFVSNLNIDQFPATASSTGAYPWGFILPVQNGEETSFYLFLFSMRKWWDLVYAYGDLWIYKARETETGNEFIENNKLVY